MRISVLLLATMSSLAGCTMNVPRDAAPAELPSRLVDFSDLDLGDPSAAGVLYDRIEAAARQACGSVRANDVAQLWARPCVQHAISRAVHDVNRAHSRVDGFVLDARAARLTRGADRD